MVEAVFGGLAEVQDYGEYEACEVLMHSGRVITYPFAVTDQIRRDNPYIDRYREVHMLAGVGEFCMHTRWEHTNNITDWLSDNVPDGKLVRLTIKIEEV